MKLLCHRPSVPNFGDDLNLVLWPALAPELLAHDTAEGFVGIGTIIGIDAEGCGRLHVFSSGVGYTTTDGWHGKDVEYHCVRGPISARVLSIDSDRVLTDGAILTPSLPGFQVTDFARHGKTVIIPHFETIAFGGWDEAVQMAGFELVDPRGTPHDVIAAIAGAGLVITESLHGAILADTFGVPWRPFAVSRNFSTAKWADWAASLGLQVAVSLVPPPDALQLFKHGKRAEPFGAVLPLDVETAFGEFRNRIVFDAGPSFLKVKAKEFLEWVPAARKTLGFNASRTARALVAVSTMEPFLSRSSTRELLREEMLTRLHALTNEQTARLALT